jgi:drug/metabolite transporter, DME family
MEIERKPVEWCEQDQPRARSDLVRSLSAGDDAHVPCSETEWLVLWNCATISVVARSYVLIAAVLFGTTGTAQALGPAGVSPLSVGASRVVIGGAVLGLLAVTQLREWPRWSPWLVLCAGVAVAGYQLAFFEAVHRAGVAVAAVVAIGSGPVASGVLERVLGDGWPGRRWIAATLLAIAGIVSLSLGGNGHAAASSSGVGLALASGMAYATYTVIAKRLLSAGGGPVQVMGAAFGTGAILLLPVLLAGDLNWLHTAHGAELAAYLAVGPTVIAYLLFARGLRRLTASETTTIVLAEPVTATMLGVAVLHESLGTAAIAGVLLVIAGIGVLALPASFGLARA